MNNTRTLPSTDSPYALEMGEGEHGHFLNHLATTKVRSGDGSLLSVVEFVAPKGFGPPLHQHDDEDELLIVLDGEIAFRSGDNEFTAGAGGMAYLPRRVPHTFQVLSETARSVSVTSSETGTPLFDQFVETLSVPADEAVLPEPVEIDGGQVAKVGAEHKISILGPPPAPLP